MTADDRTEFEAARRAGKALHQEQRLARRVEYYCELMHDAYERGAVIHGWDTNPASKHKPWDEVPEANKATMRVAVAALLNAVDAERLGGLPGEARS